MVDGCESQYSGGPCARLRPCAGSRALCLLQSPPPKGGASTYGRPKKDGNPQAVISKKRTVRSASPVSPFASLSVVYMWFSHSVWTGVEFTSFEGSATSSNVGHQQGLAPLLRRLMNMTRAKHVYNLLSFQAQHFDELIEPQPGDTTTSALQPATAEDGQ